MGICKVLGRSWGIFGGFLGVLWKFGDLGGPLGVLEDLE